MHLPLLIAAVRLFFPRGRIGRAVADRLFCGSPRRYLKQEKKQIRLAIMPLLQAEEDAKFVQEVSRRFCAAFSFCLVHVSLTLPSFVVGGAGCRKQSTSSGRRMS